MRDPWELMIAGQYASAARACTAQIAKGPQVFAYNNRGTAHLLLGDLDAALADYAIAGFLGLTGPTVDDHAHLQVAAVLWLKQQYALAASLWRYAVQQMLQNRFTHTDAGGGVHCGCLLWFAATTLGDEELRSLAEELLSERHKKRGRWGPAWPTPVAAMLLGHLAVPDLITAASSCSSLASRQLCQAHFYAASVARGKGNVDLAITHLRSSADTEAFLEIECFLARHELRRLSA